MVSRRADSDAADGVRWESDGKGEYTLETLDVARRGTTVTCISRMTKASSLTAWKVRSLVSRYSEHIGFPIACRRKSMKAERRMGGGQLRIGPLDASEK